MPGDGLLSTQTIRLAYRHLEDRGFESPFLNGESATNLILGGS
jgi:hypothetical protein